MIKDVFESIGVALRRLFANWGALLISLLLYAALIVVLYLFLATREATLVQVVLGIGVLPLAALILFFVLQVMGLSYVRVGVGTGRLLKRAFKDCWSLLAISLPIILLGWLAVKLFGYAEQKWIADAESSRRAVAFAITWGRLVMLYFLLPIIAIQLWIVTMREGLGAGFKGFFKSVGRALAPRSVLIYALVIAAFTAVAYLLLFTKTHVSNDWGEWLLAGGRVAAALLTLLIGWLITLGALAEMTARRALRESEQSAALSS